MERANSKKARKATLALLIAAHDEELVIEQTITSAIRAGMKPQHIYVVDDNSSDKTGQLARSLLDDSNVIRVRRSGKGLAIAKAGKKFKLPERYRWIHVADADGGFAPDYFRVLRRELRVKYAAATGYVKSLPGGLVSQYRVFEYTIGLEIHRRFQSMTHTVPVIPGPTSCFRGDVFAQLNFANRSLTEDFDVTLQIHRRKFGKIQFIPEAVAYTQDPRNTRDFIKQTLRWNRGIMQGVQRHKIGRKAQRVDAYLSYQIAQNFLFFVNYCLIMPILALRYHTLAVAAQIFLFDVLLTYLMAILVAAKSKRWDVLSAFPLIYAYRWIVEFVFLRSFVEVIILKRFQITEGIWSTAQRRYKQAVRI
jgi:cellulose synthase/poly-beta-1,6-N-acetylglucosamine synthase-like glycosyltransferase